MIKIILNSMIQIKKWCIIRYDSTIFVLIASALTTILAAGFMISASILIKMFSIFNEVPSVYIRLFLLILGITVFIISVSYLRAWQKRQLTIERLKIEEEVLQYIKKKYVKYVKFVKIQG